MRAYLSIGTSVSHADAGGSPTLCFRASLSHISQTPCSEEPAKLARALLAAMERRDLTSARQYLAPDFRMCFPGGAEMQSLEELVERSSKRYLSVAKLFEQVNVSPGSEQTVVHFSGRLYGTWADGREFSDTRNPSQAWRKGILRHWSIDAVPALRTLSIIAATAQMMLARICAGAIPALLR